MQDRPSKFSALYRARWIGAADDVEISPPLWIFYYHVDPFSCLLYSTLDNVDSVDVKCLIAAATDAVESVESLYTVS